LKRRATDPSNQHNRVSLFRLLTGAANALQFTTRPFLAVLTVLLAVSAAAATPAYLVKDINPTIEPVSSTPQRFASLGNVAVFVATPSSGAIELWRTDGTAAGTFKLSETSTADAAPVVWNGKAWFLRGMEIWATDGTVAGTQRMMTSTYGQAFSKLMASATHLYFTVGTDLYSTDGTVTKKVTGGEVIGYYNLWTSLGSTLYFTAYRFTAQTGGIPQFWRTDGTTAVLIQEYAGGNPFAAGNYVYFQRGQEIWRTDGTQPGTIQLSPPQVSNSYGATAVAAGATVYFTGADAGGAKLWRTDGTVAGTVETATSIPGVSSTFDAALFGALPNGKLLLWGRNSSSTNSSTLWAFDGTSMTSLAQSQTYNASVVPTVIGGLAFFGSGGKLWRTDGTVAGTFSLGILDGFNIYAERWPMAAAGSTLVFGANGDAHGNELWKTDGSLANTSLLADIAPSTYGSMPRNLTPFHNGVLLTASGDADQAYSEGHTRDLWFSDGTEAGTVKILANSPVDSIVRCGQRAFFARDAGDAGNELWSTDGTASGTSMVKDLYPGTTLYTGQPAATPNSSYPSSLLCIDDHLFFVARSHGSDRELWRTDGTAGGTVLVKAMTADPSGAVQLARFGHRLVITSSFGYPTYTAGVWITDGTAGGTQLLKTIPGFDPGQPVTAGAYSYFTMSQPDALWRTDGTAAGTVSLWSGYSRLRAAFNGQLVFEGNGLTITDGTAAGTRQLDVFRQYLAAGSLQSMNGRFYYADLQLRSSDGVSTALVGDSNLESISGPAGGRLYYNSYGSVIETDGTANGQKTIYAGAPLGRYLPPTVASGGRLFIAAQELYAYDLPVTPTSFAPQSVQASVAGQTVTITGRGFVAPAGVTVDGVAATVTATSPTSITFTAPVRTTGTYDVALTLGDGRQMSLDAPLAYVCTPPSASITGGVPAAICPLTPLTLHGSGGACHWFPAAGLSDSESCDPVVTIASTATYTLLVTNAGGCSSSNYPAVTVTVMPPPVAAITTSSTVTARGSFTASVPDAGPGATYAWTLTGGTLTSSPALRSISYTTDCNAVTLKVTVTGSTGCSVSSTLTPFFSTPLLGIGPSPTTANVGAVISIMLSGAGIPCFSAAALESYDGRTVVPVSWWSTPNGLQFRLPAGTPSQYTVRLTTADGWTHYATTYAFAPRRDDFDRDNRADILWRNPANGVTLSWSFYEGRGAIVTNYLRGEGTTDYEIVGENELGLAGSIINADVLWRRKSTGALSSLLSYDGRSWFDSVWPVVPPANVVVAATGDLDGDGIAEAIMRNTQTGESSMWSYKSTAIGVQQTSIHGGNNLTWSIVGSRDFDGDGKSDILWRNLDGSTVLWLMNGAVIRESRFIHLGGNTDWTIAALGDFDGDTKADILWRNKQTGMTLMWLMDGLALRSSEIVHNGSNLNWAVAGAGDFDFDGKADILWRDVNTGQTLYWKMDGSRISGTVYIHPGGNLAWTIEGPRF
jgi:ELWxxDGT repeat protein